MNRIRYVFQATPCITAAFVAGFGSDRVVHTEKGNDKSDFGTINRKVTTTRHWHFYRGKLHPNAAKSLKLFKCAGTPIADEIASYLGVQLNDLQIKKFADGETSVTVNEGVRGQRVYIVCSTTSVDRLMELLLTTSAMRRASAKSITAVIPFYGYARQDRCHKGREPIAAADIARMLEVMGVDHVVTMDLHSAQIEGFFKPEIPVDNLQAHPVGAAYFAEILGNKCQDKLCNPIIVAPHSAAVNRAVSFRDSFQRRVEDIDVPVVFVLKNHLLGSENTTKGELVGSVSGCDCIIVDDLVDTASTLINTAKVLKASGARSISAFCVHGRFSGEAVEKINMCEELDLLVTTNTIPRITEDDQIQEVKLESNNDSKFVTLSVAPFIAEVISCIHTKGSVIQLTKSK